MVEDEENAQPPEDGINVVGMYLEGCKWNAAIHSLDESDPKILFVKAPMFWFKPCKTTEMEKRQFYEAPIYRTTERKGVLMTTGHSTNFILMLRIPTVQDPSHWIKRGVAVICSLND